MKTPLNEIHKKYGGRMVDYSGWELPMEFSGIKEEHMAVRERAGLFDVSHMGEVMVTGKEATVFVDYLVTGSVGDLEDNQVLYTFMCNEAGGVVDDLLVYRYSSEKILLVVNAGNIPKDVSWIEEKSKGFNVSVENISEEISQLAIQGPETERILQRLVAVPLGEIGFFRFRDGIEVAGVRCLISRTGYTGEDGFEIYSDTDGVAAVWESLFKEGVTPVGLGARDTLRFEAGLPLYGNELGEDITPVEAGLGFFVKKEKGEYIGKDILVTQKEQGAPRRSVGFTLTGGGIARHGYRVFYGDRDIGYVTTGYRLPGSKVSIGLILIDAVYAVMDTQVEVEIRSKRVAAKITGRKFMEKKYKK